MSSGVSLLHQTAALLILLLGSVAIAFLPLSLLHYVYRKKRRRLREQELLQRTQQKQSQQTHPELGVEGPNSDGKRQNHKTQSRRSFIINWFGFISNGGTSSGQNGSRWGHRASDSSRTLSSRSSSASSLYQHFSEMALASTLAIPSIVLELIRSLDGGLLLAALFLILLPQLRVTFESFMHVHVHTAKTTTSYQSNSLPLTSPLNSTSALNITDSIIHAHQMARQQEEAQSAHLIATKSVSPVPLVELILCLAFFALHFAEEFAQLCLRYRKYFWACNSSVVYSSSNGTCEFSSLDYRISRTKRFLIDCSRKTSSTVSSTAASGTVSPATVTGSQNKLVTKNQFVVTQTASSALPNEQQPRNSVEQTEPKKMMENNETAEPEEELDQVVENHNLQDSLQLYNQINSNNQDFNEPNSLLSASSSSYLPSYYWPPTQPPADTTMHHHHTAQINGSESNFPHHFHEPDHGSMPYPEGGGGSGREGEHQCMPPGHFCCPCHHHPFAYHQTTPSENGSAHSSSASSTPGVFTKIFLPYTTLATSTPALYFCEGILIAIQPTIAMLWLMLIVILVHKLVTGLLVSFELHEKTTGRQRQLPTSTTVLFIVLPVVGYLTVLLLNGYFVLKQKDRQASILAGENGAAAATASTTINNQSSIEMAAVRVILFAVASATLLHLVLLIIQRNLAQFQPQLQFRGPKTPLMAQRSTSSVHQHQGATGSSPWAVKSSSGNSLSSKATNSTTLTHQVPMCSVTSHDHISQPHQSLPSNQHHHSSMGIDPEIVTNPPRYGVLHHFTMYTGFIIVLMAIAFLNMKSLKV